MQRITLAVSGAATVASLGLLIRSRWSNDLVGYVYLVTERDVREGASGWMVSSHSWRVGHASGSLTVRKLDWLRGSGATKQLAMEMALANTEWEIEAPGWHWKHEAYDWPTDMLPSWYASGPTDFRGAGFGCYAFEGSSNEWVVSFPLWFVMIVVSAPGVAIARVAWKDRRAYLRRARNRCVRCGYDLESVTNVCPECGCEILTRNPAEA
jgi:hypothetical protein